MGRTSQRIEIQGGSSPERVRRIRKRRRRGGLIYSLLAILFVVGGAIYFVHRDGQPETDDIVSSMSVTYRCVKCSKTFTLTIAEAAQMRRERGDVICPACGAASAEKQNVSVVVSGDEQPNSPDSGDQTTSDRDQPAAKAQPTLTRTMNRP
jgi:DNA-directed RNA polymerase subunit RPC12/RpoP